MNNIVDFVFGIFYLPDVANLNSALLFFAALGIIALSALYKERKQRVAEDLKGFPYTFDYGDFLALSEGEQNSFFSKLRAEQTRLDEIEIEKAVNVLCLKRPELLIDQTVCSGFVYPYSEK